MPYCLLPIDGGSPLVISKPSRCWDGLRSARASFADTTPSHVVTAKWKIAVTSRSP